MLLLVGFRSLCFFNVDPGSTNFYPTLTVLTKKPGRVCKMTQKAKQLRGSDIKVESLNFKMTSVLLKYSQKVNQTCQ